MIDDLLARVRDTRIVYGEPYEKDGVTVIPAARVFGGGGRGTLRDRGDGGGLGLFARPVGAFVIKDGDVRFVPAVDVNQVIAAIGAVVVGALFIGRRRTK